MRALEHREDGSLCWGEVVLSCSRRSGKSVILRLLALWRLVFAPALFGEQQLVVHSASTLKIAKEPQRYATTWVEAQDGRFKVSRNNNSPGIEDVQEGHRWLVLPSDKTAGLDTNLGILDESWAIKPEVVDDDLEPSLLERVSPQLWLVSTAHRRATSLMRNRISNALAGLDADRALLLLWAADPSEDPGDPDTWRKCSPHWSKDRADYISRKWDKVLAGENDVEFDDIDPRAGFTAQYLNVWPLKEKATTGDPLIEADDWSARIAPTPDTTPTSVAIEGLFSGGAVVALGWQQEGGPHVVVTEHESLAAAVEKVKMSGFSGRLTVGTSLAKDPAFAGLRVRPESLRSVAAVSEFARLLHDGLSHDSGALLTGQVLAIRTTPSTDGARLVSKSRADALKAAVWAASALRKPGHKIRRVIAV